MNSGGTANSQRNSSQHAVNIEDAIDRIGMGPFQRKILIAAGLCFAADSMEVLLLSFLSVILEAQWNLSNTETASITSSVFVGAMLGTLVLGPLADKIGRKSVFTLTAAIISFFGMATALTQNFNQLIAVRFLVGFGVGGLTVPFDTLAEMVPSHKRGRDLLLIEYFWTMGTMLVPILAYFTLSNNNHNDWRIFVALCGLPCVISTVVGLLCVPESPRWLLTQGKSEEALKILRRAACENRKDPYEVFPEGTVLIHEAEEEHNLCHLLSPTWRKTTLFLWLTWSGFAFIYYGTIIAVTLVFSEGKEENSDELYTFDYGAIFASASSEVAGTTLILLLVDRIGRVRAQSISYALGGLAVFLLCWMAQNDKNRGSQVTMAFLARMFMLGGTCATWVSTAEILTTEVRTTGHAAANAIARISGAAVPFVVSPDVPLLVVGGVLLAISVITASSATQLPETAGKGLGVAVSASRTMQDHEMTQSSSTGNGGII